MKDYGYDEGIERIFEEASLFAQRAREMYVYNGHGDDRNSAAADGKGKGAPAPAGSRLLIHCRYGLNRSPTVVVALLMTIEGMSLRDAWREVRVWLRRAAMV